MKRCQEKKTIVFKSKDFHFKFPANQTTLEKWLKNLYCDKPSKVGYNGVKLCSSHYRRAREGELKKKEIGERFLTSACIHKESGHGQLKNINVN